MRPQSARTDLSIDLWHAIHLERATLAEHLENLSLEQWRTPSLCGRWTVEEVAAHLTAGASAGRLRWLTSVIGARFDFELHNQRRMHEHRGIDPTETVQKFQRVLTTTTAASGHTAAWLGEIIVHAQDIYRPLGINHTPPIDTTTAVARFFASRDFTVPSCTAINGLRLEATDGPFATGQGPLVAGTTLALTLAMAGRTDFCADLEGDGVLMLKDRIIDLS